MFDSIDAFVHEKQMEAGCVLSGVGSLAHARLRLAGRDFYSEYAGPFEIVIAVFNDAIYRREFGEDSGFEELVVHRV